VFLVSVPVGLFGTVWAYLKLRETGIVRRSRVDWWGNVLFAVGLISLLVGITYGIQPYGTSSMGWTNPSVLTAIIGGIALLVVFVVVETRVAEPMFRVSLFRLRGFTFGTVAALLGSIGRGGLMFMVIIWLQGIWLPLHGYSFESTPFWAAIFMLPLTAGFLVGGPTSGFLSDRLGARGFATAGMVMSALGFGLLMLLPANFDYPPFASLLFLVGVSMGMFVAPNTAGVMNAVPADRRGVASGMLATFQNSGMTLSIGIFFSLMIAGLSSTLPSTMFTGLTAHGVPGGGGASGGESAAGRIAVRGIPRVQPDGHAARADAAHARRASGRVPDRTDVLSQPDQQPVHHRDARDLRVLRGHDARRCDRVMAARRQPRASGGGAGDWTYRSAEPARQSQLSFGVAPVCHRSATISETRTLRGMR